MKRLTIYADEELLDEVRQAAARENLSVSQFIRDAIRARVSRQALATNRFPFIGKYESGRADIAERYKQLLWREKQ